MPFSCLRENGIFNAVYYARPFFRSAILQPTNYASPARSSFPDLMKAINGEFTVIHYYQHLANLAPNETIKKRILEIRAD